MKVCGWSWGFYNNTAYVIRPLSTIIADIKKAKVGGLRLNFKGFVMPIRQACVKMHKILLHLRRGEADKSIHRETGAENSEFQLRFSIKNKLRFICVFSILLNLVILMISSAAIERIESSMQSFYNIEYQNSLHQMLIRNDVKEMELHIIRAIYTDDHAAANKNVEDSLQKIVSDINDLKGQFADKGLVKELNHALNEFLAQEMRVMSYIFVGEQDKALALLSLDYEECIQKVYSVLDRVEDSASQAGELALKKAAQERRHNILILISTILLFNICLILVTIFIIKSVTKASKEILKTTRCIETGCLGDCGIMHTSGDELNQVIYTCEKMSSALKVVLLDIKGIFEQMASGDMSPKSLNTQYFIGEYHDILVATEAMQSYIINALSKIDFATLSVESYVGQVSSGAQTLLEKATEQHHSISQLSLTLNHMLENSTQKKDRIAKINQATLDMNKDVDLTLEHMNSTAEDINRVTEQAVSIKNIIHMIDEIAFQTNLLALNASIEAAHAGAYGKGFSVVAQEITALARKTASAAKETQTYISDSILSFESCCKSINQTSSLLNNVADRTSYISEMIREILSSVKDDQTEISNIASEVEKIRFIGCSNTDAAEQFRQASEHGIHQVSILKRELARFTTRNGCTPS